MAVVLLHRGCTLPTSALRADHCRRLYSSSASPSGKIGQTPSLYESLLVARVSLYSEVCSQTCAPTLYGFGTQESRP